MRRSRNERGQASGWGGEAEEVEEEEAGPLQKVLVSSSGQEERLTAIASISTLEPLGKAATCTVLLAGGTFVKCFAYSSFIFENSERSTMKTVVFTTSASVSPTIARTSFRFVSALFVCATIPSRSSPLLGSSPVCPEQKT